jgi:hypothetical protein
MSGTVDFNSDFGTGVPAPATIADATAAITRLQAAITSGLYTANGLAQVIIAVNRMLLIPYQ